MLGEGVELKVLQLHYAREQELGLYLEWSPPRGRCMYSSG